MSAREHLNILAIIPARKGSKGLPGKNKLILDGKPLVSYAIEVALKSLHVTDVVINTDDLDIAEIATGHGVHVFSRKKEQAKDDSLIGPVIRSTIEEWERLKSIPVDAFVLLQVTAPLRTAVDVDNCISMLMNNETDGVISVVPLQDLHPARMYEVVNGLMIPLHKDLELKQRQELPPLFIRNGCIYVIKKDAFLAEGSVMVKNKQAYIMDEDWWVNLDGERDLVLLRGLISKFKDQHPEF